MPSTPWHAVTPVEGKVGVQRGCFEEPSWMVGRTDRTPVDQTLPRCALASSVAGACCHGDPRPELSIEFSKPKTPLAIYLLKPLWTGCPLGCNHSDGVVGCQLSRQGPPDREERATSGEEAARHTDHQWCPWYLPDEQVVAALWR